MIAALVRGVRTPRFAIYLACAVAAVLTNALLGKDMMWDTLNYHLYAGFSALHDRFGSDYFAAGPQSYFNPYIYVPFYLLATSKLPAVVDASILALVQSPILWLTYELVLEVVPRDDPRTRVVAGGSAAALAFANPILIGQLGSSYADILTAELVLAGWLLLLGAARSPSWTRILGAGVLLGAVSALKLTNVGHALSASVLVLFLPGSLRARLRCLAAFGAALGLGFLAVAAPWAIRLEHHFGNPFFPLLNHLFRSPQYSTGTMLDYRFIPDSLLDAFWRPFAILAPTTMVDNELVSPDLRYALLMALGAAALIVWLAGRHRRNSLASRKNADIPARRGFAALLCAFLADWALWLRVSGNGRYFLAMACVAGVLVVAWVYWLVTDPKLRTCLLVAIFFAQATLLLTSAQFRYSAWWDGGRWFEVFMPKEVPSTASLYFTYGNPSNAFIAPFLPRGSGVINIDGDYELDPRGANGDAVKLLIHKYAPHLQILMVDGFATARRTAGPALLPYVDDALEPFGLRAEPGSCVRIAVRDAKGTAVVPAVEMPKAADSVVRSTKYIATCHLVPGRPEDQSTAVAERSANVVFDRLEDACPEVFPLPRPVTRNYSLEGRQLWARRYIGTNMVVEVGSSQVMVASDDRLGAPQYLGRVSDWERAPLRVDCGRRNGRYYAKLLPGSP